MRALSFFLLGTLALGCASTADSDVDGSGSAVTAGTDPSDLTPADWNIDALADSPSPGSEPINVIITTNVKMDDVIAQLPRTRNPEQGLLVWRPVELGTGFGECISEERATIDGPSTTTGKDAQQFSLRLGGLQGCEGVIFDGESHARGWKSDARSQAKDDSGRTIETWYLALSQEHVCAVAVNGLIKPWHCILPQGFVGDLPGISGSIVRAPTGGYNQGRDQFVANLKRLAEPTDTTKLTVDCESIERTPSASGDGANGSGGGEGLFVPVNAAIQAVTPFEHKADSEEDPRTPGKQILKRVTWDSKATHCKIMQ